MGGGRQRTARRAALATAGPIEPDRGAPHVPPSRSPRRRSVTLERAARLGHSVVASAVAAPRRLAQRFTQKELEEAQQKVDGESIDDELLQNIIDSLEDGGDFSPRETLKLRDACVDWLAKYGDGEKADVWLARLKSAPLSKGHRKSFEKSKKRELPEITEAKELKRRGRGGFKIPRPAVPKPPADYVTTGDYGEQSTEIALTSSLGDVTPVYSGPFKYSAVHGIDHVVVLDRRDLLPGSKADGFLLELGTNPMRLTTRYVALVVESKAGSSASAGGQLGRFGSDRIQQIIKLAKTAEAKYGAEYKGVDSATLEHVGDLLDEATPILLESRVLADVAGGTVELRRFREGAVEKASSASIQVPGKGAEVWSTKDVGDWAERTARLALLGKFGGKVISGKTGAQGIDLLIWNPETPVLVAVEVKAESSSLTRAQRDAEEYVADRLKKIAPELVEEIYTTLKLGTSKSTGTQRKAIAESDRVVLHVAFVRKGGAVELRDWQWDPKL